jgi:hypothetical protein
MIARNNCARSILLLSTIASSILTPFITDQSHHPIASLSESIDRDIITFNYVSISLVANYWHYDSS